MAKSSSYRSKTPDETGIIAYTAEEDAVWRDLYARQEALLPGRVSQATLDGLAALDLPKDRVPQLPEVNERLAAASDFGVAAVPALISPTEFFTLLAERKFPVATFIRRREDFDYLQEPDIFHEVCGHCPMLANRTFADFLQRYGELALTLGKPYAWRLQRLFWFTVEFGLIADPAGTRIYGAGIASSPGETLYALKQPSLLSKRAGAEKTQSIPEHRPFDVMDVFRTPYRIDIYQPIYYVIRDLRQLLDLFALDLAATMDAAKRLGSFAPTFEPKEKQAA